MPDLFTNQASYLAKQGEKITYYFPELDEVKPQQQAIGKFFYVNWLVEVKEEEKSSNMNEGSNEDIEIDNSIQPIPTLSFNLEEDAEKNNNEVVEVLDENIENVIKASEKSQVFHCQMTTLNFESIRNGELQGYSIRLELLAPEIASENRIKED